MAGVIQQIILDNELNKLALSTEILENYAVKLRVRNTAKKLKTN